MRQNNLLKILFLTLYWVCAAVFIVVYDGVVLISDVERLTGTAVSVDILANLGIVVAVTLVAGAAIAACEVLYLNNLLRRRPLGLALLLKTAFYVTNICIFTTLAILFITADQLDQGLLHATTLRLVATYMLSPRGVMTIAYWSIAVMSALFVLQVSEKLGQGVLVSFLLGRYHRPREETLIFLFMDLKSSTAYAEQLGHMKYSRLIQDCFADLTETVVRHDAQIYQYVGDEVVLTWSLRKGLANGNCLAAFFDYDRTLREREPYYKATYGVMPEFKAGLNLGQVMVAEVGQLKKELAYHGDALNTTARLQEQCNAFLKKLLVSEPVREALPEQSMFEFHPVGVLPLKGKQQPVSVYEAVAISM